MHLEEQLLAFAQCLAVHGAASCIRVDRYVPKPLCLQGNRGGGGGATSKKAQ